MNWLKYLVGLSAVLVAGCAAYFSVTGLGVLFAGASISVMVMAGSLELAKLVAATYLKQEWDSLKGFNKWYLTISVATLMLITSAGIFGYLSNAFQQQNLSLQKVERDIAVYQTQIEKNDKEIERYTTQLTNQQNIRNSQEANLSKQIDRDKSTTRVTQMIRNADKEITTISKRIDELTKQNNVSLDSINSIKNANIDLEREVGGFRFVADAFGVPLNDVVKFFILIIVLVFDPLAVALIIAFNGLLMKRKEEEGIDTIIDDGGISDLIKKNKDYEVYGDNEKKRREELLSEIMEEDQKMGLYDDTISESNSKLDSSLENLDDVIVSPRDGIIFANAIENPPQPNEELKKAVEDYKEKLEEESGEITLSEEEKKKLDSEITDEILLGLKPDYSERPIDLDGDGTVDGIDTNGDGMIDRVTAPHPNRAMVVKEILPYYARPDFNWNDRKNWINDQNAVNFWIKNIKPKQYPDNFESKTY